MSQEVHRIYTQPLTLMLACLRHQDGGCPIDYSLFTFYITSAELSLCTRHGIKHYRHITLSSGTPCSIQETHPFILHIFINAVLITRQRKIRISVIELQNTHSLAMRQGYQNHVSYIFCTHSSRTMLGIDLATHNLLTIRINEHKETLSLQKYNQYIYHNDSIKMVQ